MYDRNLFNLHRASYLPSLTLVNLSFSSAHPFSNASIGRSIDLHYLSVHCQSTLPAELNFDDWDMFISALRSFGHGVPPACGNRWTYPARICQAICTVHKIDIKPIHYGFGSQMTQQVLCINTFSYTYTNLCVCVWFLMPFSEVAGFIRPRCLFMAVRTAKWQSLSMSIGLTTATTWVF